MMARASDGANVRFPPPVVYLAGLAIGIAAGRIFNLPSLGLGIVMRELLGGFLVLAGIAVSFSAVRLFLRSRTAIIPFKSASSLVTSGMYRWTRNPMYLGLALAYAGVAILLDSLPAMILLPLVLAAIQVGVIAKEEAYLERAFGDGYSAYKQTVRRWI